MPEVLAIERESFEFPWSEEDFRCCLRLRNCIGMVVERNDEIVGFVIYELHKGRLHILNFAVGRAWRRKGVGTAVIQRLRGKLRQQRRRELITEVRESNVPAQLFFRSRGFRAVRVLRDHYDDTNEDCYVMRYELPDENEWNGKPELSPANRITQFVEE